METVMFKMVGGVEGGHIIYLHTLSLKVLLSEATGQNLEVTQDNQKMNLLYSA